MKNILKFMTFYDKGLILVVIFVSILFITLPLFSGDLLNSSQGKREIIIQADDQVIHEIPVGDTFNEKTQIYRVKGPIGTSIIEVHNGKVRMKKAPPADPHKICEKTGWIQNPGPRIICVPNKITIWIKAEESKIDGISR